MDLFKIIKNSGSGLAQRIRNALSWYGDRIRSMGKRPIGTPPPPPSGPIIPSPPEPPTPPSGIPPKPPIAPSHPRRVDYPHIGKMYLYTYDPKYKNVLPYYDMFPLVVPIHYYNNGFLGLNLHYLPPTDRAGLLMALYDTLTNNDFDDDTKFNVNYGMLKNAASKYAGYENCVKRYLFGHVKSEYIEIYPAEWENVVVLPLQRWIVNPNRKYSRNPPY